MPRTLSYQGTSLLELLIAMAIGVLFALGGQYLFIHVVQVWHKEHDKIESVALAQQFRMQAGKYLRSVEKSQHCTVIVMPDEAVLTDPRVPPALRQHYVRGSPVLVLEQGQEAGKVTRQWLYLRNSNPRQLFISGPEGTHALVKGLSAWEIHHYHGVWQFRLYPTKVDIIYDIELPDPYCG